MKVALEGKHSLPVAEIMAPMAIWWLIPPNAGIILGARGLRPQSLGLPRYFSFAHGWPVCSWRFATAFPHDVPQNRSNWRASHWNTPFSPSLSGNLGLPRIFKANY